MCDGQIGRVSAGRSNASRQRCDESVPCSGSDACPVERMGSPTFQVVPTAGVSMTGVLRPASRARRRKLHATSAASRRPRDPSRTEGRLTVAVAALTPRLEVDGRIEVATCAGVRTVAETGVAAPCFWSVKVEEVSDAGSIASEHVAVGRDRACDTGRLPGRALAADDVVSELPLHTAAAQVQLSQFVLTGFDDQAYLSLSLYLYFYLLLLSLFFLFSIFLYHFLVRVDLERDAPVRAHFVVDPDARFEPPTPPTEVVADVRLRMRAVSPSRTSSRSTSTAARLPLPARRCSCPSPRAQSFVIDFQLRSLR